MERTRINLNESTATVISVKLVKMKFTFGNSVHLRQHLITFSFIYDLVSKFPKTNIFI